MRSVFALLALTVAATANAEAPIAAGSNCAWEQVASTRNAIDATRGPFQLGLISLTAVDRAMLIHQETVHCNQKNASPRVAWVSCEEMLRTQSAVLNDLRQDLASGRASQQDYDAEAERASALTAYCAK